MNNLMKFTVLRFTYIVSLFAILCILALPLSVIAEEGHEGHNHAEEVKSPDKKAAHDDDGDTEKYHEDSAEEEGHEGHDHSAETAATDAEFPVTLTDDGIRMAGIKISQVTIGHIGRSIDLPGEVGFDEDRLVHISPRFPGIAKEARFRVGDYVKAGAVMAVVESNESMSSYNITAPISGWIIQRHITTGEFVSGENSMYVLADLSKVWVNLAVYPKDADLIKQGMKVHINAIGTDLKTDGTIEYVTQILDVSTRSITARIVLPNPNNRWRPGTFVHALVSINGGVEGLVVEKDAVQILDGETVVFVSNGVGGFRPVQVETGEQDHRLVRIVSGLAQGADYVSEGAFELKAKIVTSSLGGHAGHGH